MTDLPEAYALCRDVAAEHGKTYFLATRLLPTDRRPAVHALYAFARMVDDIIDVDMIAERGDDTAVALDLALLTRIEERLNEGLASTIAPPTSVPPGPDRRNELILAALFDTARRYDIPSEYFTAFMTSMLMDVPHSAIYKDRYATMDELSTYMYGSAAVIGLQMLPILGTVCPVEEARPTASALGEAFQVTNFVRDAGEDLARDRIYLPGDVLTAYGVDEDLLWWCRRTDSVDPRVRRALADIIATTRALYRTAEPGIALLEPRAREGIRVAFALYQDILEAVENDGYRSLSVRSRVGTPRRARVAATAAGRGLLVRAGERLPRPGSRAA
ncbi:phytoene/squalene synthase family protein [Rhodococcus sp. BP-149]|uniref:phytoene/squalene synthase family protein n=1 Tax=unclassified Rhodococcus (in: high G+C Gram-positive bacteria) TaxID=192944 RepID=UPI001C9ACAC7|nr:MULTISPECIES: phytoene/squalene synthase family protein [unclassified Rhodococcus (in: high G+C Gram-positive bacteria)]MBY6686033.1 phytoene/squalene synthase family protein [Rhodococcus sp. BP-288]MBY6696104.1 phytoene/squalene synthase family protein [Rhodococcus sp. BP-188]MBY6700701.1 phytoene/squalene synthase family protein [Rhodococcus sp. BP-285]MBY6703205.1 phytoene/squalene synthase family protein [Rhodococcus sp. BP-283]MBY6711215.1 phytoene/squalene synthase family protein [Rho